MKFNLNIRLLSLNNVEKWINQVEEINTKHNCIDQVTIDVAEGVEDIFRSSYMATAPANNQQ